MRREEIEKGRAKKTRTVKKAVRKPAAKTKTAAARRKVTKEAPELFAGLFEDMMATPARKTARKTVRTRKTTTTRKVTRGTAAAVKKTRAGRRPASSKARGTASSKKSRATAHSSNEHGALIVRGRHGHTSHKAHRARSSSRGHVGRSSSSHRKASSRSHR